MHELIRGEKLDAINLGQRMTRVSEVSLIRFEQDCKIKPEDYND